MVAVVLDHRAWQQRFARLTDAGHAELVRVDPEIELDATLRLARAEAPIRRGVAQLDVVVVDQEIDRRVGATGDDHPLVARELEEGRPEAVRKACTGRVGNIEGGRDEDVIR